jgi:hypothetical protein
VRVIDRAGTESQAETSPQPKVGRYQSSLSILFPAFEAAAIMANAPTLKFYCCSICSTVTAKPSCPEHPDADSTLILVDEVLIVPEDDDAIALCLSHDQFTSVILLRYLPASYEPLVRILLSMLKNGAVSGEPVDWSYIEAVIESWFPQGFYPCI